MHKILVYLYVTHLLKSSTCFEHYPAHHQEVYVVIVYIYKYAASGIVTLCRWLSCTPVHMTVTCRQWRYQSLHI